MDTQKRIICRLCLKVCDSFKDVEGYLKGILWDMVLKEVDLTVTQKPVICTYCAAMLIKYSQFKTKCLEARNCKLPFIGNKTGDRKLSFNEVYPGMSDNGICGFCLSPVKSSTSFDFKGGDITFKNMIEQCLPELDFSIVKKLAICAPCRDILENCFCFVTNCSNVEEKIKIYCKTRHINGEGQIELSNLLEFITGDATVKKESADEGEIGNGYGILKEEQMLVDVNESVKAELELENKSCIEMDDYLTTKKMLVCEGDIKIEEIFCGETGLKEETVDVKDQMYEEVYIKMEENDFSRSEYVVLPPPEVTTMYKCSLCSFQTKLKGSLKRHNMLKHTDSSEVTIYKCTSCSFQTKLKNGLKQHDMLNHKDASELTMYKCDYCPYQTKHKNYLKEHLLKHKDPSEVTMYECGLCSFQTKLKSSLRRHMLTHKDPSEVTVYKCATCLFQTIRKGNLKKHSLMHKDASEITMYKCDTCSYETISKNHLKMHLLTHKDPSEVTMYKCDTCLYRSCNKHNLKKHLLKHKDPSEVTMYKCDTCSYQTKRKDKLKEHLLKHRDPSEVTMYKCDNCFFQTKHKNYLKEHSLRHKDPAEVTMYKCSLCPFKTRLKKHLNQHNMLKHKDPSD